MACWPSTSRQVQLIKSLAAGFFEEAIYTTRCRIAPTQTRTGGSVCSTLGTMMTLLKRLFGKRNDEAFVTLMQVAFEDQNIRQQLLTLLVLPHPERQARLQQWRRELQDEQAPPELINAMTFLEVEAIADQALKILEN